MKYFYKKKPHEKFCPPPPPAKPFNKQIKVIYLFIVIFSLFIFSCNKVSLIQPTTQESTYTFEQLISDPNFPAEELSNKKLSEIIQSSYSYL
ncbi:MAG: hypothetical protein IPL48_00730 [Bacteroidetes bacterium]|nr:hypothetical protein [Bacteroidota bacterium]